jgi:hypothetical protein
MKIRSYLDQTKPIQDQYHNQQENYSHETNLNQEQLFVVVMDH